MALEAAGDFAIAVETSVVIRQMRQDMRKDAVRHSDGLTHGCAWLAYDGALIPPFPHPLHARADASAARQHA